MELRINIRFNPLTDGKELAQHLRDVANVLEARTYVGLEKVNGKLYRREGLRKTRPIGSYRIVGSALGGL